MQGKSLFDEENDRNLTIWINGIEFKAMEDEKEQVISSVKTLLRTTSLRHPGHDWRIFEVQQGLVSPFRA